MNPSGMVTLTARDNDLMQPLITWTTKFKDAIGDKVTALVAYMADKKNNSHRGAMAQISKARWVIP